MVVLAAVPGARDVVAEGGPDAGHLVGGHAGADPRPVHDDAPAARPVGHVPGDGMGDVRVVDGLAAVGAAVGDREAVLPEPLADRVLEHVAAMVPADGDRALSADGGGRGWSRGRG